MKSTIEIFAEGAREGVYPGGQLAVSKECNRLITTSVGTLTPQGAPTSGEAIYDLASLTKPLATTLLVGRALERNLCRLEDPLAKYVPSIDGSLTIEHALEHSTGYPAHRRFDELLPASITPGSWDAWRYIVFRAAQEPRLSPPGEVALYSDIGFILLGAALEVIFCLPLSTCYALLGLPLFFRDRRGPPSMPAVPVRPPLAPTEGCLPGVVHDENARVMGGAAGQAGIFGTADGVLRVAEQLVLAYHGWRGGILSPETVRRMWQPSLVPGSTRTLGWDRPSKTGSSTGGRWPRHAVGHLGFTGTSVWIEPDSALIVVFVTNRVCPTRANNMIRRLRPMLYDAAWTEWGGRPRSAQRKTERLTPTPRTRPLNPAHTSSAVSDPELDPLVQNVPVGAEDPTRRISLPGSKTVR